MAKTLRMTPSTLKGDDRRRFPWRDGSRSLKVPLWTAQEKGDLISGRIEVPKRLCHSPEHSNARLEFEALVRENLQRWVQWREQRGWTIASFPKVRGPYVVAHSTGEEVDDEIRHYYIEARFIRTTPVYVGLDDLIHELDAGKRYGIDATAPRLPWNDVEGDGDSGWVNPMEHAAQRRERLGLKRKDYLWGAINNSQAKPKGVNPL